MSSQAVCRPSSGFRVIENYERYESYFDVGDTIDMSVASLPACSLCNSVDDLKMCNRCKSVWYCSVAHQREHYKQHKVFCKDRASANQSQSGGGGVNGIGAHSSKSKGKKKSSRREPATNFTLDSYVLDEMMRLSPPSAVSDDRHLQLQGSGGIGMGGGDRRGSFDDPDFAPPIDPSSSLEAASHHHSRSKTPSLVQVCPDAQSLEEGGFSQIWFAGVMQLVMRDLNKYGVCVVDNFLGSERADQIRSEVEDLHVRGVFRDGQVVSRNVQDQARGIIRGDKITWVTGNEPSCGNIGQLVSVVDNLIAKANKHQDAGELARYNITWRTRAMVACYPGQGSHYVKHVDNPDGDGRCITAIYYINKGWTPRDGGELRIYPEGSNKVAKIDPVFDRMLFFWSDRRNPHEVLPATVTRFAITVWYHDQTEREEYLSRVSRNPTNT